LFWVKIPPENGEENGKKEEIKSQGEKMGREKGEPQRDPRGRGLRVLRGGWGYTDTGTSKKWEKKRRGKGSYLNVREDG